LVLLGLGAAFGISRIADQDTSTYEGPMVERSRAMQYNTGALLEGNWPAPIGAPVAQIFIDGIADTYAGPLVDRSLAMEDFFVGETYAGPLVDRSLAMEDFFVGETYAGPLVDRSLAMEDFYKGQEHFRRQNSR
jgi:hypothetical protein